jgi:DNA-binding response OmpR family regulator
MPGNQMLKISLIEDDPDIAALLHVLLEMEGYSVRTIGNHHVHALLEAILLERPQIALIDVNLAKGNGLDLVRSIRREPEIKETCILMTSGLNLEKESLQAGADGFIQKPFMPDELMKLIQNTYQQSYKYQPEKE